MKTGKLLIPAVLTLIAILVLQSCATIFGGRASSLQFVNIDSADAQVFLDDSLIGDASGKIKLTKGLIQHGSMLEIRSEGYKTEEYRILLKPNPGYVVADIFVGAVPLIIDFGTGDILRPQPRKFNVSLEEE